MRKAQNQKCMGIALYMRRSATAFAGGHVVLSFYGATILPRRRPAQAHFSAHLRFFHLPRHLRRMSVPLGTSSVTVTAPFAAATVAVAVLPVPVTRHCARFAAPTMPV